MNKHDFFKQFYPDYQQHEVKMKALQSAWDKLSVFTKPQELAFPTKRIGNYEVMLEDWKGKAPKGNSWEIDGKWYYDFEAADSIEFPDGFYLPTRYEWLNICNLLEKKPQRLQEELGVELNGYYNGTSVSYAGSYGYYWSSTYYNTNYAYNMYFNSGSVNPQTNNYKYLGFAVRCIRNC